MRAFVSVLVPDFLGRLIYKFIFYVFYFLTNLILREDVEMWYRNSLKQKYFKFLLSDIDVSVEFQNNRDIVRRSERVQNFLRFCPLIKEVNFYYPFCKSVLSDLANPYELKRDSTLFSQYTDSCNDPDFLEACKFTYLFRMFMSNLENLKRGLHGRDKEKWLYHFNLTDVHVDLTKLKNIQSEKHLLFLIFSKFPHLDEKSYTAIKSLIDCQEPSHIFYKRPEFKKELLSLLPHTFAYTGDMINELTPFLEQVFICQMSWEVLGMLTQPVLFSKGDVSYHHLNNMKLVLSQASLINNSCAKKRITLIKIIDGYLDLLIN